MRAKWWRPALGAIAALGVLPAGVAHGARAVGPRSIVDLEFTSVLPNAPVGYRYRESFRHPTKPGAEPPAVRAMAFTGPPGGRVDTGVRPASTASDDELKMRGESACPPGSRIGAGKTTTSVFGFADEYDIVVYNGPGQEVDVVKFHGRVVAVVRERYQGANWTNELPTCVLGGQPPEDCPSDQVRVLSTDQGAPPIVSGTGPTRRSLLTNPPTCPATGFWPAHFAIRFGDGATDRLGLRMPCTRPRLRLRRRGCTVAARVTGRDLRDVSSVIFYVDGRRVARDRRAPYRLRRRLSPGRLTRVTAIVRAYGVTVSKLRRSTGRCR